jgi:hypothetical protein
MRLGVGTQVARSNSINSSARSGATRRQSIRTAHPSRLVMGRKNSLVPLPPPLLPSDSDYATRHLSLVVDHKESAENVRGTNHRLPSWIGICIELWERVKMAKDCLRYVVERQLIRYPAECLTLCYWPDPALLKKGRRFSVFDDSSGRKDRI